MQNVRNRGHSIYFAENISFYGGVISIRSEFHFLVEYWLGVSSDNVIGTGGDRESQPVEKWKIAEDKRGVHSSSVLRSAWVAYVMFKTDNLEIIVSQLLTTILTQQIKKIVTVTPKFCRHH